MGAKHEICQKKYSMYHKFGSLKTKFCINFVFGKLRSLDFEKHSDSEVESSFNTQDDGRMVLSLDEDSIVWPGGLVERPTGLMIPTHLKVGHASYGQRTFPTNNNALLINFRLSSDAKILLISTGTLTQSI